MCNILILQPNQMPKKDAFWNMCYNNWHSFGLIVADPDMSVVQHIPENEEIDPQMVWDLICENKEYTRYLHVRHITAGTNTLDNCHPLTVADEADYSIYFMHNGTMEAYRPRKWLNNTLVYDDEGPSDTQTYADSVLRPFFDHIQSYEDERVLDVPIIRLMLNKAWPLTNRGLLVSSDGSVHTMGDWKKIKADDDTEILSSNDTYFDKVIRGPEFERREVIRKAEEEKNKGKKSYSVEESLAAGVKNINDYQYKALPPSTQYRVSESFKELFNDINFYDREGMSTLGYCTRDEIDEIYSLGKVECGHVMDYIFTDYANLVKEYKELEAKHQKASAMIAGLKAKIEGKKAA